MVIIEKHIDLLNVDDNDIDKIIIKKIPPEDLAGSWVSHIRHQTELLQEAFGCGKA